MNSKTTDDDWKADWDVRLRALENELGKSEDKIATSPVPIYLGGGADVLMFKNHVDGVAYVTAGLVGSSSQQLTELGEYELMMCFREENDWAPSILSRLAPFTFQTALPPGEFMEITPNVPKGATIVGLVFAAYRHLKLPNGKAGILSCIGITATELASCRKSGTALVLERLKRSGIYPFTEMNRQSVLP